MTDSPPDDTPLLAMTDRAVASRDARLAREAAALRANLVRRKAQARSRTVEPTDADLPEGRRLS